MKRFLLLMLTFFSIINLKGMEKEEKIPTRRELQAANLDKAEKNIWGLGYSPDDTQLAIAYFSHIDILDLKEEKVVHALPVSKIPMSVRFCDDGERIVSVNGYSFIEPTDIQYWDSTTGESQQILEGYFEQSVENICSPNGKLCLHVQANQNPSLWNIEKKESIMSYDYQDDYVPYGLAISSDAQHCAMAGADPIIKIFNVETGKSEAQLRGNKTQILALAYLAGSNILVSGSDEGDTIKIWDVLSGKIIQEVQQEGSTLALACSPNNTTVAYTQSSGKKEVQYFEINSGKRFCLIS